MPTLVFPDANKLRELGTEFATLAHVPIVVASSGQLLDEPSDYLRHRALMVWRGGRNIRPSANTVRVLGYDLTTFLDWCDAVDVSWKNIERGQDTIPQSLTGYARMMSDGRWSQTGKALDRATIDRRLHTAWDFLAYAADRGWRAPIVGPTIAGYGKTMAHEKTYAIPAKTDVAAWLDRLRGTTKPAQWLMVQMIFEGGLRREEVVRLRASDIPTPDRFSSDDHQHLTIRFGTKGGRQPDDPTHEGRPRTIRLRTSFVERLHVHKMSIKERQGTLSRTGSKAPELFLNPQNGEAFSPAQLNKLFNRAAPAPTAPWTPHMGRHFYACWTLLEFLAQEAILSGMGKGALAPAALEAYGKPSLLRLQTYLGHASPDTTDIYLRWASEHLRVNGVEGVR